MPMYPDGFDGFYFYLYNYMEYLEEALRKNLSGRVIMAVDIDAIGEVVQVRAVKA